MENHFTINYLQAIKEHLHIDFNTDGKAVFYPEKICDTDFVNLKSALDHIWKESESAISILRSKEEAIVQMGLFGLVDNLDLAVKVGFSLGDRIVLIDYLYERILSKYSPTRINITHIGSVASALVGLLPLAERGRIVMIPNPFAWHSDAKKIISEVAEKTDSITPELLSLLNMLSITKHCNLHPYTIAESTERFQSLINQEIEYSSAAGLSAGRYAYDGILGALLSEKIINETELNVILDTPINQYFDVISQENDFYRDYIQILTNGGALSASNNIDAIKVLISKAIKDRNEQMKQQVKKVIERGGGIGGGVIGILGMVSVISAPLALTGALLGFAPSLTGLLSDKEEDRNSIISVFSKLLDRA